MTPPHLSLVLQLESLFLETNDPSPPLPGSQLELMFLETNDPLPLSPWFSVRIIVLRDKRPPPPPFP